jgi:hypothetical protein
MKNALTIIIDDIPKGTIFDSHYVISQLIKNHSDAYLKYASAILKNSNGTTATYHGQIALRIAEFDSVENISEKSWSENIHGISSSCTAWKKI